MSFKQTKKGKTLGQLTQNMEKLTMELEIDLLITEKSAEGLEKH